MRVYINAVANRGEKWLATRREKERMIGEVSLEAVSSASNEHHGIDTVAHEQATAARSAYPFVA